MLKRKASEIGLQNADDTFKYTKCINIINIETRSGDTSDYVSLNQKGAKKSSV